MWCPWHCYCITPVSSCTCTIDGIKGIISGFGHSRERACGVLGNVAAILPYLLIQVPLTGCIEAGRDLWFRQVSSRCSARFQQLEAYLRIIKALLRIHDAWLIRSKAIKAKK